MKRKYSTALDMTIAALALFKQGNGVEAASYMQRAVEAADFDETLEELDDMNEDAMDEEEASMTTTASVAFAAAAKRLKVKADANDVAPVSTENLGDGDLPGDAGNYGTDNTPELRGEKAVEARLARAERNAKRLGR